MGNLRIFCFLKIKLISNNKDAKYKNPCVMDKENGKKIIPMIPTEKLMVSNLDKIIL